MRQRGFTLLELIVAMSVFAVLAMLAYQGLNNVLLARSQLAERSARLTQLQTAWMWLERDLTQLIARPVRDEYGVSQAALRTLTSQREMLLEFTRSGWRNPVGLSRASLVRVGYGVKDNQLLRWHWPMLDRNVASTPYASPLLDGVRRLALRYMDRNGEWLSNWPPAGREQEVTALPRAVEVELETEGGGRMQRLFIAPGEG